MEKKDFKNWNWDDTGLLCDLKGDAYDTVKKYLKEIDFDKVDDGESYSCIVPVVRKIISSIIDGERQFGYFKNKIISVENALLLVNVDDIVNQFNEYCKVYLPITEKYLSNIDCEAELAVLFSRNYVFGLIKKLKENGK